MRLRACHGISKDLEVHRIAPEKAFIPQVPYKNVKMLSLQGTYRVKKKHKVIMMAAGMVWGLMQYINNKY